MGRYVVWVTEEVTKKVWFDANGKNEAERLLQDVWEGELELDELPNSSSKIKESDFSWTTPKSIEEED